MERPVLTPAARRLWRDPQTLQLGRGPGAVMLAGIDPGLRRLLSLLDGALDRDAVVAAAAAAGCPPERTGALLAALAQAGLLSDAASDHAPGLDPDERDRLSADHAALALLGDPTRSAVRRRRAAYVHVLGAGRVGASVAALLDGAGVGALVVDDDGITRAQDTGVAGLRRADVGRPRGAAVESRLSARRPGASAATTSARARPPALWPDIVVLSPASPSALDDDRARLPPGITHLLAEVRDNVGVVGPLVLPGSSACLRCLDLTRTDRDPAWPALAAQLSSPVRGPLPCDGVLAVAVAAQTCQQVLALLDGRGRPASVGGTLELALPDWRWRRRSWPVHPACGCAEPLAATP